MATPSTFSSGTVDSESLRRQKEEIAQAVDRANRGSSRGVVSTPGPASTTSSLRRSLSSVEPNGDIIMAGTNGTHTDPRTSIPPRQLPTPVMNGIPPTLGLVNGSKHPDQAFAPPRNLYSESDNPLERKFRDPGKGKFCFFKPESCVLTNSRSQRRTHLVRRVYDPPQSSWRPKMEAQTPRIRI